MKVTRVVCSSCNQEVRREVEDKGNLHNYQEEVTYKRCPNCPPTAASRLLDAIFGVKDDN